MRLTFTALLLAVAAFGQHPAPKNLKLLPADENLIPTMRAFQAALGVKCDFCHVQNDFASDEKHTKEIARFMITMAKDVNAKFTDGKMHVTCYTCHRGAKEPATAAAAAAEAPK
jgi:hypothetical protein